ncbi:MAG: hypothetical protein HGN29_05025 [Asgard group archaeon]|nr:hypothetical protein [Asgard group archaeon]
MKKKKLKQKKSSIIEQIRFYETDFELKEENIDKITKIEEPEEIISLLFLLDRVFKELESPQNIGDRLSNYLDEHFKKLEEGIKVFVKELEREKKFKDGTVKELITKLGIIINQWEHKYGVESFTSAISNCLKKCKKKTERVLIEFVGEYDYKTNLMVLQRTRSKYVKQICLEELERMRKRYYEWTLDEGIEIINGVKKGLYKRDFEISWRTERVVSAWMNLIDAFRLSEEELEAEGLKLDERARRRGIKLSKEYMKRIESYLKEEGKL